MLAEVDLQFMWLRSASFLQLTVTSSALGPNIVLIYLFAKMRHQIMNLCTKKNKRV